LTLKRLPAVFKLLAELLLRLPELKSWRIWFFFTLLREGRANGSRSLRVGGRGFCLGAGKTQSEKNAAKRLRLQKCRRPPASGARCVGLRLI